MPSASSFLLAASAAFCLLLASCHLCGSSAWALPSAYIAMQRQERVMPTATSASVDTGLYCQLTVDHSAKPLKIPTWTGRYKKRSITFVGLRVVIDTTCPLASTSFTRKSLYLHIIRQCLRHSRKRLFVRQVNCKSRYTSSKTLYLCFNMPVNPEAVFAQALMPTLLSTELILKLYRDAIASLTGASDAGL